MNYKAYTQEPHAALIEIKRAFDEEKVYKAQSICLSYFNYLENQHHINKALDYYSKDDVYKYMQKHMKGELASANISEGNLGDFKLEIESIRKDRQELATIMKAIEQFCVDNNMEMEGLLTKYLPKQIKNMTKEELVELSKAVTERQKNRVAMSKDVAPMPTFEEMESLAKAQTERATAAFENTMRAAGALFKD